jgi:hypothetical protein
MPERKHTKIWGEIELGLLREKKVVPCDGYQRSKIKLNKIREIGGFLL